MYCRCFYVYMLTNKTNSVIYTGVTNNLVRRVFEHKRKWTKGFTEKYNVDKLVYYEVFDHIEMAIRREKQIKGYTRNKKEDLINAVNPVKEELYHNGHITKLPSQNKDTNPSLRGPSRGLSL
ncbi:predicted endonuclease, GIY-YIG superfamily [Bacteroidales bacterium 6E]|nr:predicted endonuclease, GIY-YIG superfamily [Bacteroidales bacterium 6E]